MKEIPTLGIQKKKIANTQTNEINSKVVNYENYTFVTRALFKNKILEFGGLGKENNRQLRMKVRTCVNKRLLTDKRKNILLRACYERDS